MIRCTINGQEAVPSLEHNIKVTMENAHIKDRDSWSMDITFPMSIEENARIFTNTHRLEVSRRVKTYDECALYVHNQLVIRGVGIVVGVNQNEVKLQIKSGIQRIAYKSEFENVYIDRLSYNTSRPDYRLSRWEQVGEYIYLDRLADYQTDQKDKYILVPIYDTKNKRILNEIEVFFDPVQNAEGPTVFAVLHNHAVQPNLNFVLRTVMARMGYTMNKNALRDVVGDLADAYICNARLSYNSVGQALPHWTVKKFLDEVRRLYNITYIFDDEKKTVTIIPDDPLTEGVVEYECQDTFTTDYNEQGLSYVGASNLEYNLADSDYRWCSDDISEKAMQYFEKREYASWGDLQYAWEQMSEQDKMTTIFLCPFGTYYTQKWEDENEVTHFGIRKAKFQHLTRIEGSDNPIALNIAPVTIGRVDVAMPVSWVSNGDVHEGNFTSRIEEFETQIWMPCMEGEEDDGKSEYLTVQSVAENGGEVSEDEDERMEVMFLGSGNKVVSFDMGPRQRINRTPGGNIPISIVNFRLQATLSTAQCTTDPDANPDTATTRSFALTKTTAATYIGQHHEDAKIIENQEQTVIKFLTRDRPEPTKVHQFRNKRYLCEKIEMEIGENGIKEEKTGYFYEMI